MNKYKILFTNRKDIIKSYDAQKADLDIINEHYSKVELKPEDVRVYKVLLANDMVDRDNEKFDSGMLKRFSETILGKGLLESHNRKKLPRGKYFEAWTENDKYGTEWLATKVYILDKGNEDLIHHIDGGVYDFMSIGFNCRTLNPVRDDSDNIKYWKWEVDKYTEALEGSLVWLGAQFDAAIGKDADEKDYYEQISKQIHLMKVCTECKKNKIDIDKLIEEKANAMVSDILKKKEAISDINNKIKEMTEILKSR